MVRNHPLCVIAVAFCLSVCMAGCNMDSSERVELYRQQLARYEALLVESDAKIDVLQSTLDQGMAMVQDPNAGDMQDRQKLWQEMQKVRTVLDGALGYKGQVQAWIVQTRQAIEQAQTAGPVDLSGELGLIGQAVSQGGKAVGGETGLYIGLGGLILSLLGNLAQKRKTGNLTATLSPIVRAVESLPPGEQKAVKAAIAAKMVKTSTADAVVNGLKS